MSRQRSDGVATRGRLLDAAAAVFATRGYHDAKTAEICRRAHANIAAVNYHFGGKEKLYVASWRHAFERSIAASPPDGGVPASAPAEARLRGRIVGILRRLMDPASLDFSIAHREMANPTGLLSEVIHRSIEPLREGFVSVVRELLGPRVTEQQIQLCEMSIHAQCFGPLAHERHRRPHPGLHKPPGPKPGAVGCEELADHIHRFSLAGLREVRRLAVRKRRP